MFQLSTIILKYAAMNLLSFDALISRVTNDGWPFDSQNVINNLIEIMKHIPLDHRSSEDLIVSYIILLRRVKQYSMEHQKVDIYQLETRLASEVRFFFRALMVINLDDAF